MTVIVVGNGPIPEGTGPAIDAHDVVIRINHFEIEGFESMVGEKTTIWAIGGTRAIYRCQCPRVWNCYPLGLHKSETDAVADALGPRLERVDVNVIAALNAKLGQNAVLPHPSTGLVAVEVALHKFGPVIDVVGFDHFQHRDVYYWGNEPNYDDVGHQPWKEKEYMDGLVSEGKVRRI